MTFPLNSDSIRNLKRYNDFSAISLSGTASAFGHHGELIQGMFTDGYGKLCRGLVSLPCPEFDVKGTYLAVPAIPLQIVPHYKKKALHAAQLTLEFLHSQGAIASTAWGGTITLDSKIPEGYGLGSSTADVVAAIRVVANTFNYPITAGDVAILSVKAEKASDPIMFDGADGVLLFAQREARVLEVMGQTLPSIRILGVNTAPEKPVSTNDFPPAEYNGEEIATFAKLRIDLRDAMNNGDVEGIGRVATASAIINQKFLPTEKFSDLLSIVQHSGAAGIQVAHSGTVAGLIYDAANTDCTQRIALARIWLAQLKLAPLVTFGA